MKSKHNQFSLLVFKAPLVIFLSFALGMLHTSQGANVRAQTGYSENKNRIITKVTINGFGKTATQALQNASENALKQVVGSFLQSETSAKKRIQINDGIAKQTKLIRSDINEYSQGSIKSINVLNMNNIDGVFYVVAEVLVRVDDFKAYIEKLAIEKVSIGKGLFAQVATEGNNQKNRLEIFEKTLLPIVESRAARIKVGEPIRVSNFSRKKEALRSINQVTGIVVPIEIYLDSAFQSNMLSTLDGIASSKKVYFLEESLPQDTDKEDHRTGVYGLSFIDFKNGTLTTYGFDKILAMLKDKYKKRENTPLLESALSSYVNDKERMYFRPLRIRLIDSNGKQVKAGSWRWIERSASRRDEWSLICDEPFDNDGRHYFGITPVDISSCNPDLINSLWRAKASDTIHIVSNSKLLLILNLSQEKLERVSDIEVTFAN